MPLTVGTAAPSGDLVRAYSRRMGRIDSNRANLLRAACARDEEATLQNVERAHIPNPTLKSAPTDRSRNADWKAANYDQDQEFLTLAIDKSTEDAVALDYRDAIEAPLRYLELKRSKLMAGITTAIEDKLYGELVKDAHYPAASATVKKSNFVSDASAKVDKDGEADGAVGEFVVKSLARIGTTLTAANRMGPAMGTQIDRTARPVACFMNPFIFEATALYLLEEKYSLDSLTTEVLDSMSIRQREAYKGSLFGIDIMSTPAMFQPGANAAVGANGVGAWNALVFSPEAVQYAERPPTIQYLTPETNQTKPGYELKHIVDYGFLVTDPSFMFRIQVRTQ